LQYSLCTCVLENDTTSDELQNSVKKLGKLCKSTQIVREHTNSGEDNIDKVPIEVCDDHYELFLIRLHHLQSYQNQVHT